MTQALNAVARAGFANAARHYADQEVQARSIVVRLDRLRATRHIWAIVFLLSLGGNGTPLRAALTLLKPETAREKLR